MIATYWGGETGHLLGRFPYVRAGSGDRDLLVVPGYDDTLFEGEYPPFASPLLGTYFGRFLDTHTVWLVSRPRGLPEGATIGDFADGYAEVIAQALDAPDVLGISMGGMIAIELAALYPGRVARLVLADSGARIHPDGRAQIRQIRDLAANRAWADVRATLSEWMFADWRAILYPPMIRSVGRFLLPKPAAPADPVVAGDAVLAYDGRDSLGAVRAPTLVIGGERDTFFPPEIQRETAAGIDDARHSLLAGAKHGAFHHRKVTFDRRVSRFLAGGAPSV